MTQVGVPGSELRLFGPTGSEVRTHLRDVVPGAGPVVAEEPDGVVVVRVADADDGAADVQDRVRSRWDDAVVSTQGEGLAAVVVALLEAAGLRLAVAESLTGGLLAHEISEVPGAGTRFVGGLVAYANEAKHAVLGVPEVPVVSEHAARAGARP